jgi:purine-nucleoside phosphorylase
MKPAVSMQDIDRSVECIRRRSGVQPRIGIILGSGLGAVADAVEKPEILSYKQIPGWPVVSVPGHAGRLVLGCLGGWEAAVVQGRLHYYEGIEIAQTAFPVRVLHRLGVDVLILTNAAGAVNPDFNPGDLMLITDHLNLMGFGGANPLRGPNDDCLGPRFPDMSRVYDERLRQRTKEAAATLGIPLREGVYTCVAGPSFETPAELRFLRMIGTDAVGMSTVPEAIAARHAGMRVLGLSAISNKANLDGSTVTEHEAVLAAGRGMVPDLQRLIRELLRNDEF